MTAGGIGSSGASWTWLRAESACRGAAALTAERGGHLPWCGPAALALAAGQSYAAACALLRQVAPERYPDQAEIVTCYWRDMLAALQLAGLPPLWVQRPEPRPTLLGLARSLQPGFYLVRVTGHFLLLQLHGFGLAQVHDNRLSGAVLSVRTHGRCRVTHLARLPLPALPGLAPAPSAG